MKKRRNGEQHVVANGAHPGKIDERVGFVLAIAKAAGRELLILRVTCIGIEGNLVIIAPRGSDQAKLILGALIEKQRAESAVTVFRVVLDVAHWRLQAVVAAISIHAGEVSDAAGVAAKIQLIVGLKEIAEAGHRLGLIVASPA